MDALKGIGHACGHNLIAISGVAVACALKEALEEHSISATIQLLGTPGMSPLLRTRNEQGTDNFEAEEGGSGKVKLLEAGAYKEMDICLMYANISRIVIGYSALSDETFLGVILLLVPKDQSV